MDYKKAQQKSREAIKPKVISLGSRFNRVAKRRRSIDRTFTKKGFSFGVRIDSREYNLIHHIARRQS